MLSDAIQVLMSGIALGSVYTLMALGLFLTYATSRAMNFGQGDYLALAAFLGMAGTTAGLPVALVAAGVCLVMAVLGAVGERLAVRPVTARERPGAAHLGWILTTLGLGMVLQNAISTIWGKSRYFSPPLFSNRDQQVISVAGAKLYAEELAVAAAALVLVGAVYWLLYRSAWGKRVAAVSFHSDTARLLGVDVRRTVVGSYVVMGVLSACAGVLVGPLSAVQSHMGLLFLLKAFAVISIGGFAHPLGVLIGGLGFGIIESLSNYLDSSFGDLYPFLIVLVFLVFRPTGLFGERKADVR